MSLCKQNQAGQARCWNDDYKNSTLRYCLKQSRNYRFLETPTPTTELHKQQHKKNQKNWHFCPSVSFLMKSTLLYITLFIPRKVHMNQNSSSFLISQQCNIIRFIRRHKVLIQQQNFQIALAVKRNYVSPLRNKKIERGKKKTKKALRSLPYSFSIPKSYEGNHNLSSLSCSTEKRSKNLPYLRYHSRKLGKRSTVLFPG